MHLRNFEAKYENSALPGHQYKHPTEIWLAVGTFSRSKFRENRSTKSFVVRSEFPLAGSQEGVYRYSTRT